MNKYGMIAEAHWRTHCRSRFTALGDPAAFFDELGTAAAAQVEQLRTSLESRIPAGLPYLERVARLRAAQRHAEEVVLSELVYSVEPEATSLVEELEQILSALPSPRLIEDHLERARQDAEDEAERDGRATPLLSDGDRDRCSTLTALLPLVSCEPGELTETELRERIEALQPYWDADSRTAKLPK